MLAAMKKPRHQVWDDIPGKTTVAVIRVDDHPDYPLHSHRFREIVFVTGGSGVHHIGSTSYPIRLGDVFVINDRECHAYTGTKGLRIINVLFDCKKLGMNRWPVHRLRGFRELFHTGSRRGSSLLRARLHVEMIHFGNWLALVSEMERCQAEKLPCWESLVELHFHHLVLLMSRAWEGYLRSHDEARERMGRVVEYLEKNFTSEIEWPALAREAGVSERTFRRLFMRATKRSPLAYLIRRRIEHACDLLRNTEQPVTQIAHASGFSDSNYFAREFRKIKNESPTAYRQRWAG
jgi:AraC-like DNA-binding protein